MPTSSPLRIIPAIKPTPEQWAVIDSIHDPYVKQYPGKSEVMVYEIKDDSHVALYTIQTDGSYVTEELLDGLGYGWTTLDSEGYEIDHEGVRISDKPDPGRIV